MSDQDFLSHIDDVTDDDYIVAAVLRALGGDTFTESAVCVVLGWAAEKSGDDLFKNFAIAAGLQRSDKVEEIIRRLERGDMIAQIDERQKKWRCCACLNAAHEALLGRFDFRRIAEFQTLAIEIKQRSAFST